MKYSKNTWQNITKRTDVVIIRVIIVVYVFHHCYIKNLLKVYKSTLTPSTLLYWNGKFLLVIINDCFFHRKQSRVSWLPAKTSEILFLSDFIQELTKSLLEVCLKFSSTYFNKFFSYPLQWHSTYPFKVWPKKDVSPLKYLSTMIFCSFDVSSTLLTPSWRHSTENSFICSETSSLLPCRSRKQVCL